MNPFRQSLMEFRLPRSYMEGVECLAQCGRYKLLLEELNHSLWINQFDGRMSHPLKKAFCYANDLSWRNRKSIYDWIRNCIGKLIRDSDEMEELGFRQMDFLTHTFVGRGYVIVARRDYDLIYALEVKPCEFIHVELINQPDGEFQTDYMNIPGTWKRNIVLKAMKDWFGNGLLGPEQLVEYNTTLRDAIIHEK